MNLSLVSYVILLVHSFTLYVIVIGCNEPDLPSIGTTGLNVAFNNTRIGSRAVYSCVSGYNLIGNSTRTCQVDGSWTGTPPYCQSEWITDYHTHMAIGYHFFQLLTVVRIHSFKMVTESFRSQFQTLCSIVQ